MVLDHDPVTMQPKFNVHETTLTTWPLHGRQLPVQQLSVQQQETRYMPKAKLFLLLTLLATGTMMLNGCSPIPDLPGPIGIPGL
jgi:hypothetical protein